MSLKRIWLIGDSVAKSRLPALYNALFTTLGLDYRYEAQQTTMQTLSERLDALRSADPEVIGLDVAMAQRQAILPLLDALESNAARIGAVNTVYRWNPAIHTDDLVFSVASGRMQPETGMLVGANTDAPGLLAALREDCGFEPADQWAVVLGSGPAARAAVLVLVQAGARQIVVANRTLEHAEALLADIILSLTEESDVADGWTVLPPMRTALPLNTEDLEDMLPSFVALALHDNELDDYVADSTLLVNATALGWQADETPLPEPPVHTRMLVYDMVCAQTQFLQEAAARGARTADGTSMLVHQSALALQRWTGVQPPIDIVVQAVSSMNA